MRLQGSLLGFLGAIVLCLHCTPDMDKLTADYGQALPGGDAGSDGSQGGTSTGGTEETGGTAPGEGGTAGEAGEGGQAGSNVGGGGGSTGGKGGTAGTAGKGGSAGKGGTGGTAGGGGAGGIGPLPACPGDGCALIVIPADTATPAPVVAYKQYFTINIDLSAGVDLSDSIITTHVRAIDFKGTTETVQLYASALPAFAFWGNRSMTVPLSTLAGGAELTMDLTGDTGSWDAKHVISVGLLFSGGSKLSTVKLLVEDFTATVKADPTAAPKAGPWLFAQQSEVNETPAESVPSTYNVKNILFGNPYQAVPGARPLWVAAGP